MWLLQSQHQKLAQSIRAGRDLNHHSGNILEDKGLSEATRLVSGKSEAQSGISPIQYESSSHYTNSPINHDKNSPQKKSSAVK